MRSERCRVVVKLRPTLRSEFEALDDGIHVPASGKVVLGKDFEVDHVYHPSDGDAVYEDEVQGLVKSLYDGINATVFAYGASGSGKTHTVLGSKQTPGLVDRITDEVFARYDQRTCTVSVSVEELYCERFTDLLAASAHPPATANSRSSQHSGARSAHFRHPLQHRQAAASKYSWQKMTLTNSEEMKALVQHVLRKRHTASTCLNDKSSRSHVIVTITLEQRKAIIEHKYAEEEEPPCSSASSASTATGAGGSMLAAGAGSLSDLSSLRQQDSSDVRSVQDDAASEGSEAPVDTYLIGKLYLVDLAGSENIKRSGAEGARQKEAGEINKSLCHLKTVIEEVFKGRRVTTYRNSKLTFRLQDALGGGNSKLLVVACISTARQDLAETKETLRFAEMARAITNTPVVNREPKDELIHRLQLQVAELQDQLKTARQEGGRAAAEEVLTQLNAVEAALADLQEEKEVQEAAWKAEEAKMTDAFVKVNEEVGELHTLLSSAQANEASLAQGLAAERTALQQVHQQLAAERSALQQVRQLLAAEQGSLQATLQTGAATAGLLLDMRADVSMLQQCCGSLQQQVTGQQAAAAAAVKLCIEQQQQAQVMQQQLSAQDQELQQLRRQLQQERAARTAAESHVSQLLQQQEAMRLAAERCAAEVGQGMQQMALLCTTLQEHATAAASQQQLALQQHQSVQSSLHTSEGAQEAAKAEISRLQQQLETQQQEHAHELNVTAAQAARAAAAAAAEHLQQCRDHEQQLQAAQATISQLQVQLEDERTEHAAMLLAEQQKHEKQLAENMHSSVKKLMADKLRCKEHMRMPLSSLMDEARVLSDALASPTPIMIEGEASSRPASPTSSSKHSSRSSSLAGADAAAASLQGTESAPPALRASKRVSPVPRLQLEASEAMLSDTTAAPMQDASERHLSELYTDSEGYSSGGSSGATSPGDVAPLQAEQKTAALVAVAAAAAAMTAARLTPRRASVHVHAEGCSHGGYSDSILSRVDSFITSDGRDSPADRMMLPACGSLGASPSIASLENSQHGGSVHPAATAAATAAAAAVAAGVRSSQEQQRRHRRRRREFTKSFSAGSWPISYTTKDEVDEEAAAAAFSQLRCGELNVSNLQRFLEHRMLGNKLHSRTLVDGRRKRKHELIQDMLAYHQYYLASRSTAGSLSNPTSSNSMSSGGADVPSEAAAPPTPPSQCSSPESEEVWHPLPMLRPASADLTSATCSPAKLDFARYSVDATVMAAAAGRSSGGGSSSRPGQLDAHAHGRIACTVEAADANSSRQQPDRGAAEQQQQGRWSWLTPRRRKQQSILAQLQTSGKPVSGSSHQQGQGMLWSPEPPGSTARSPHGLAAQQQQQAGLSVQMPRYVSEGGCDAVSPRDKRHTAAAAGRAAGTGSNPSSRSTTPAGIRLSGKAISAVTGSAVAEFYVDSPAVKLGRRAASKQPAGGVDPGQLSVDLGSAHRSGWRQAQLLRPK